MDGKLWGTLVDSYFARFLGQQVAGSFTGTATVWGALFRSNDPMTWRMTSEHVAYGCIIQPIKSENLPAIIEVINSDSQVNLRTLQFPARPLRWWLDRFFRVSRS